MRLAAGGARQAAEAGEAGAGAARPAAQVPRPPRPHAAAGTRYASTLKRSDASIPTAQGRLNNAFSNGQPLALGVSTVLRVIVQCANHFDRSTSNVKRRLSVIFVLSLTVRCLCRGWRPRRGYGVPGAGQRGARRAAHQAERAAASDHRQAARPRRVRATAHAESLQVTAVCVCKLNPRLKK